MFLAAFFVVLTANFAGLATFFFGLRLYLLRLAAFLLNKAIFDFRSFVSASCQLGGGAGVGAILGRLIADIHFQVRTDGNSGCVLLVVLGRPRLDEEAAFLTTHGPFGEPGVARHFGDELAFDIIGGLLGLEETLEEVVVLLLVFAREDLKISAQTMLQGILRDLFLTRFAAWPGAFAGVRTIRCKLTLRDCHKFGFLRLCIAAITGAVR